MRRGWRVQGAGAVPVAAPGTLHRIHVVTVGCVASRRSQPNIEIARLGRMLRDLFAPTTKHTRHPRLWEVSTLPARQSPKNQWVGTGSAHSIGRQESKISG